MAHRFNMHKQKKTPKLHARERTWSRWRSRHAIETKDDEIRKSRIQEVKEQALERASFLKGLWLGKR